MKKKIFRIAMIALAAVMFPVGASAQFNLGRAAKGLKQAAQAVTLTDEQMAAMVQESVTWMDKNNEVAASDDPYAIRLAKLTEGITDADGIPLNFKVYKVTDVNAFACPDGSVRVFSALMDLMTDDELMGIIGHEIGHVMKRHSKNGFKQELLTGAMKDALASTSGRIAKLTDSQLATLGTSLIGAKYSQKQEKEADNCGYDFLRAHGRNPWGMVMAFEKFLEMEGGDSQKMGYIQKMFSSHPETKDRIKAMTERCRKDGIKRPSAASAASTK